MVLFKKNDFVYGGWAAHEHKPPTRKTNREQERKEEPVRTHPASPTTENRTDAVEVKG